MGMFVISKRYNGDYKFEFTSRKGKTIFTSISCKHKEDCELMIAGIKSDPSIFAFTRNRTAAGKHFFRLSKGGLVLATSRKFASEVSVNKGISDVLKYVPSSDILDFSENDFVFPDAEEVFIATEP